MHHLGVQEASESRKKFWARLSVSGLVGLILAVTFFLDTKTAVAGVTVSPTEVKFKAKVGTITYGLVTITNTGASSDTLTSADAKQPFWPTYGGTCNVPLAYVVPAGKSCTFEFGFKPTQKGQVSGQGAVKFQSGATLTVQLKGVGQ